MKFCFSIWTSYGSTFLLLLSASVLCKAQTDLTSPYSLFGPGLPNLKQTVSQAGMGGSGAALYDPYKMNISNPAIVAYHLEPIFETSVRTSLSRFSSSSAEFENKNLSINNLSLSFPIQRGVWGLTVGLSPYTTIGYNVSSQAPSVEVSATPKYTYSGDGGISQGYFGMGYKFLNKVDTAGNVSSLAFGANFNFNFGTLDNSRRVTFPQGNSSDLALNVKESVLIRDASLDLGVHYQTNLIKRSLTRSKFLKLLVGAVYSLGNDLNAQRNFVAYNFRGNIGLVGADTLAFQEKENGYVRIPNTYTLAFGLDYTSNQRDRLRFSLDISSQEWSDYSTSFSGVREISDFNNSQRLSTGVEYTPDIGSAKFFNNVEYRMGFKYEKSYLKLRGSDIRDVGMSFGLSLPIHHKRAISKSSFHLATQIGRYGTEDNGLIQENYIRIYGGFSFTPHFRNRWFVQTKYD